MSDKKTQNSEQTVTEIVEYLTNKVSEISELNGELKADNRTLEAQVKSQEQAIRKLKSEVQSLERMQENLIQAASKLGINLKPVLNQTEALWVGRGLELAGIILKPRITALSIPDFSSARSDGDMHEFLVQLPGFGAKDSEHVAEDQYGYTQATAEQLILREKH